jgi:hypothetical protein
MAGLTLFLGGALPTERRSGAGPRRSAAPVGGLFLQAVAAVDGPLTLALRRYTQAM